MHLSLFLWIKSMNRSQRRAAARRQPKLPAPQYQIRAPGTLLTDDEISVLEMRQLAIIAAMKAQYADSDSDSYTDDHEVDLSQHINTMYYCACEAQDADIYQLCGLVIDEMRKAQQRKIKYRRWIMTETMIDLMSAFMLATFGDGGFMRRCSRGRLHRAAQKVYDGYRNAVKNDLQV